MLSHFIAQTIARHSTNIPGYDYVVICKSCLLLHASRSFVPNLKVMFLGKHLFLTLNMRKTFLLTFNK